MALNPCYYYIVKTFADLIKDSGEIYLYKFLVDNDRKTLVNKNNNF